MRPILFAFVAMVLYAVANVVLEQKLARYNTLPLLACWYMVPAPILLSIVGYWKVTERPTGLPNGWMLVLAISMGVLYLAADSFFVGAYTQGGNLLSVTSMTVLFPAMAIAIKQVCVGGTLPNRYQVAGYILAALAVVLTTKGSLVTTNQ